MLQILGSSVRVKTTSRLQPCDAGITHCVKVVYRQKLLRHLVLCMDEATSSSSLLKQVNVLDTIMWTQHAFDSLSEDYFKVFRQMWCGETDDQL